jgi:hypothetical protein
MQSSFSETEWTTQKITGNLGFPNPFPKMFPEMFPKMSPKTFPEMCPGFFPKSFPKTLPKMSQKFVFGKIGLQIVLVETISRATFAQFQVFEHYFRSGRLFKVPKNGFLKKLYVP